MKYVAFVKVFRGTGRPDSLIYFTSDLKDLHKSKLDACEQHVFLGEFDTEEAMNAEWIDQTWIDADNFLQWR